MGGLLGPLLTSRRGCSVVSWMQYFYIAAGGSLGALGRYFLSFWVAQRAQMIFPWGTLIINLAGSFAIGFLFELFEALMLPPAYRAFFSIGFLGAFTTFSTFSLETVNLLRDGEWRLAALNVVFSVFLGVGMTLAGMIFGRLVLKGLRG